MPEFDELHQKYLNNNHVKFYTVFLPSKSEEAKDFLSYLDKYNYKFNQLFCMDTSSWKSLSISYTPEYMIIKNMKVIYRGTLNTKWNEFLKRTDKIINKEINNSR